MSKRIITPSNYRKITCSDTNCACIFSFDTEDIIVTKNGDTVTKTITCPVCKQVITITQDIPTRGN